MKIKSEIVTAFLRNLKLQVSAITDTVKSGDYGVEECIKMQVDDIHKIIDIFVVENLVKLTPIKDKNPYLEIAGNALKKLQGGNTYQENIAIYQSRLYAFVKRNLQKIDFQGIKNDCLAAHIENTLITGSNYEKEVYSNEWFYSSQTVFKDIATEIIELRKKAPQLTIEFPAKIAKSNRLIDLL